ncbi:MAG: TSUP family transporter [Armatimonadota bacterium]|nr:TSUP family transporter [Armatimonadota bacterium]MDR7573782.1 TSUP family transporter [Armatimonadota bacterium]
MPEAWLVWPAALLLAGLAFFLSASAGLGGSLILVPGLALLLGVKQGVALATLLLAWNNVAKVVAYRRTIPWRPVLLVLALLSLGAAVGARLLVAAEERAVQLAVLGALLASFLLERWNLSGLRRAAAPALALAGGLASGFSGTTGPLKGLALRTLGLDRLHFPGAASLVSLAGDATKLAVFVGASLLDRAALAVLAAVGPLMVVGTAMGYTLNTRIGERAFTVLFWAVIGGYAARLVFRFAAL